DTCQTIWFVFVIFPYWIVPGPLQQFQSKVDRILAGSFGHLIQKSLFHTGHKIGAWRSESSDGNVRIDFPLLCQIIFDGPRREPVGEKWGFRYASCLHMEG